MKTNTDKPDFQSATPAREPYPALEAICTPTVPTQQAAHYLTLKPQTLRIWACKESGPIRPRRINGRLHWSVAELRELLGVC